MRLNKITISTGAILAWFLLAMVPSSISAAQSFDTGLGPIQESKAYLTFRNRPYSELSRLIYLIDRFKEAKMVIVYDKIEYATPYVAKIARWFLPSHHKGEKAEEWIMVWCNTSYTERQLIWVKDQNNQYKLSRELLTEELKALDEVYANDPLAKGKKPML